MKRAGAVLAAVVAVVAAVVLLTSGSGAPSASSEPTAIETAALDQVDRPTEPVKPPKPKFTRTIFATSSLSQSDLMLDFCKGPVAIFVGEHRPTLVAEHDYCGGLAWMPKLAKGDAIKLSGDGVQDGTYVVRTIKHGIRNQTKVRELPDTDIVLQTCVSHNTMVLVGMDLFDPSSVT